MAITTKNRATLKSYFVKNAIPTEANFTDLVDAQLNMKDDGVFKLEGEPLSVVAAQGEQRRTLRLYSSYPAPNPDWLISLKPAQDPADASTTRAGFGVADGTGATRLFIDPSGNLGVGTNAPSDRLTVSGGDLRVEGGSHRRVKLISDQGPVGIELVAREEGQSGSPYIDFTHGQLDSPNFGVRLVAPNNEMLKLEGGALFTPAGLRVDGTAGHLNVDGAFYRNSDGQVYITVDDVLRIRDQGSNSWAAEFNTNSGSLSLTGGLSAGTMSTMLGVAVNDASNTGVGRGVWFWAGNDPAHVIYSANPSGKSPANNPAPTGHFGGEHRLRFRTYDTQGFLFENHKEKALLDISATDGSLWTNGHLLVDKKLGVGTTEPDTKLHVEGGDVSITGGRYRRLRIVSDKHWAGIELVAREDGEAGNPHIDFTHGDLDDPNFGIRVQAPNNTELTIEGGRLNVPGGINVGGSTDHIQADGSFYRYNGQAYITIDDNLYIRDTDGSIGAHFDTNNGNLNVRNNFGKISDAREKTDIHTIEDPLAKVLGLRGVSFQWADTRGREPGPHLGLLAQEVLGVLPEVVGGGEGDERYHVYYDDLVPVLIEAIKAQQSTILELEQRLAKLEA